MHAADIATRPTGAGATPAKAGATYRDVLDAPAEVVAEILHGDLYLSPRPGPLHAGAAGALYYSLAGPFRFGRGGPGGWVLLEEPELHLEGHARAIVPDVAGWRRERMPELPEEAAIALAPDWVCEVLSPSTEQIDRALKMPIYARAGVEHLWLVNPALQMLEAFRRYDGGWLHLGAWTGDGAVRVAPFDAVETELVLLWSR